tara:strand:+ start:337 stop:600 length:264 start_codon:yes stop_codon:yes gene_type:complete
MTYLIALLNKNNAIVKNINRIPQDAIAGEKLDFKTNTPNILSRKMNKKPKETPIARLEPVPPLLLNEETEIAIIVNIKHERGIVYLL